MDALTSLLAHLRETTGVEIPENKMTEEEYVKFKCNSYNDLPGSRNELDGYECKKCKNRADFSKPVFNGSQWIEVLSPCSCRPVRNAILRLMKSGLKNIVTDYTFDKFETPEPWQATLKQKAVEYAKNPEKAWFFLGGQSGCGKTHLCTAIAREFLLSGKQVQYMVWRDEIMKIKANITDATAYDDLMQKFKTATVLYIDDLFKNGKGTDGKVMPPTGSDVQTAIEILNYRYNNKELITIISSERSLTDLLEIDESLAGRISEMSYDKGFCINIKPDRAKNHRIKHMINL